MTSTEKAAKAEVEVEANARDMTDFVALQSPVHRHGTNRLEVAFDTVKQPSMETTDKGEEGTPAAGKMVSMAQLFTYADKADYALMIVGTIGAIAAGVLIPFQMILYGDAINAFNPDPKDDQSGDDFREGINKIALNLVIAGFAMILCCFLQIACWSMTASRQAKRIRSAYVSAILKKEIGWFDVNNPMQLSSRVAESTVIIQEGIGRKVGNGIYLLSMAISGVIIALIKGWELALILIAFTPALAFSAYLSMNVLSRATQDGIASYGAAGAIAQESLSNIRTVHMFNLIDTFVTKYEVALRATTTAGIKKGFAVGWGTGLMFFTVLCAYAAGMFYGALMIANDRRDNCQVDCYDGGRVVIVFMSVVMGAMALGEAGPSVQAIVSARAAAYDVFAVIARASLIDPLSEAGTTLAKVTGHIEIDNVSFAYPSRPEIKVCSGYSLSIRPGETVALVGPSGSGKSTIVSLLERFYDPLSGSVKLDGVDVRDLNVKWLREQIGLVGQEPVLFAASIMENIRHGYPGATDEQVMDAAKMANAHSFVSEFPRGFDTEVGERGAQLSGGQKQRIAIARAILKNPPVLLLDEATSALDTESERTVQESLDKLLAASNRTTVIVAHRLSTIRNADKIAVHSRGSIVELGSHETLMNIPNGHYRMLVETQNQRHDDDLDEAPTSKDDHKTKRGSVSSTRSASFRKIEHEGGSLSMKQDDAQTDDSDADGGKAPNVSIVRLWKLSLPELKFLLSGAVGAIVNAAIFPVWAVLFVNVLVLFFEDKPRDDFLTSARYWSLGFVGLGVLFGASITLQHYSFGVAAQRLVTRVRLATFKAMLHQEIGWFDLDENSSGALVSRLATDSAILQAMTSDSLNGTLVNLTSLGIATGICFYYSWQMTLLIVATAPVMLFTSYVDAQMMSGTIDNKEMNDADTAGGSLLAEAISSIRTVASFSMEKPINTAYVAFLNASKAADTKAGLVRGVVFGASQGAMFFSLAFLYYMGAKWVSSGAITFKAMFMVIDVIMMSMFAVGMATQNMSDQSKVKRAATRVFSVLDRTPKVNSTSDAGITLSSIRGELEFRGVQFAYPSRPDAEIYQNYNLKVASGQTVALVGASGSGKSTAISLLERFYDPAAGGVTLDGTDLRALNLSWLRERVSLVSQEPVLFAGTIADNIAMGKPGSTREEVMEAAKKANAYEFILNFPHGFDTDVGDRGAQVSGGQKQRIAIARAILRDPDVLLLDEATSALDNESERVVQESLNHLLALKKRTTIIVAHRLSTIRNADLIAVTKEGAIVEQGTHDQLMALPGGVYKSLVARQTGIHD